MKIGIFQKKLLLERALNNIQPLERASTEAMNTGPSKKKVLLKRVLGKINLLERAPEILTGSFKKETTAKAGPQQHPATGAGPY